jgi:hypothetical protein
MADLPGDLDLTLEWKPETELLVVPRKALLTNSNKTIEVNAINSSLRICIFDVPLIWRSLLHRSVDFRIASWIGENGFLDQDHHHRVTLDVGFPTAALHLHGRRWTYCPILAMKRLTRIQRARKKKSIALSRCIEEALTMPAYFIVRATITRW